MEENPNVNKEDQEIKEGKVFAMIAYWFFLCILPLILKKDNRFAVYHGKQGLVLFILFVAGFIISIIPFLGPLVFRVVSLLYLLTMLWGTFQALKGRYSRIIFVSDIADNIIL